MGEEEILALFQKDVETGAAALVEQYRYLLWGVCARRLSDPEDIWECVYSVKIKYRKYAINTRRSPKISSGI